MIFGIGTDIARVARIEAALQRHGEAFAERILTPSELIAFRQARHPARLLTKRFAAKEAFGKALGIGVAAPATLHAVGIDHDALGKPFFKYDEALANYMAERKLVAHLSLSDEVEFVVAYAIVESVTA